jgi:uncharacterized PurR-regulated membrane protein YhhQ (DUF165 family)
MMIRHLRIGYWSLALFVTLGLALEAMHAFKVAAYLDVESETRRLMWRLAHAHGTLLGLLHVAYGLTVRAVPRAAHPIASSGLTAALLLIPGGFFAGGMFIHAGDPSVAVALVPVGFVALLVALVTVARSLGAHAESASEKEADN